MMLWLRLRSILSVPYFHDEAAAYQELESMLWPDGPVCPHCGGMERSTDVNGGRIGLRRCGPCKKQFTVKVGRCSSPATCRSGIGCKPST
jgi:hypothetical protein